MYKEKIQTSSDVSRKMCFENLTLVQIYYHFFSWISSPFVNICLWMFFCRFCFGFVHYKDICLQFTLTWFEPQGGCLLAKHFLVPEYGETIKQVTEASVLTNTFWPQRGCVGALWAAVLRDQRESLNLRVPLEFSWVGCVETALLLRRAHPMVFHR